MVYTLWTFETARFRVECTAEEEWDVDVSWDETGETLERLQSGEWEVFCAKVAVYLDGREIAADYLGQCIYADPSEFVIGHRDPDPMNRNCSVRQERHRSVIAHYFPGMVAQAISEARAALQDMPHIRTA